MGASVSGAGASLSAIYTGLCIIFVGGWTVTIAAMICSFVDIQDAPNAQQVVDNRPRSRDRVSMEHILQQERPHQSRKPHRDRPHERQSNRRNERPSNRPHERQSNRPHERQSNRRNERPSNRPHERQSNRRNERPS